MRQRIGNWFVLLLLILILGRFVTQTYGRMLTNSNSAEGDQSAFLQLGLDLQEQGVLTDGTRNPLYAAFLALIAEREWTYFTRAKLMSMIFGMLAIVALYHLGRRYFNRPTGLVAAYLLSINTEFIVHSATALTESLLVLIFILTWFAMLIALDHQQKPHYWAIAGVLAGLAYLTKGSGQLLIFAFLVSALLIYRLQLFHIRGIWAFLMGYALVASPLWIYNTIHFGSPTFNFATTHQMWMERWTDWHPDAVDDLPTAVSYLQTHSISEIIDREWQGMRALRNILIKTLWPTRTLKVDRFLLSPISGYTLALLALLPLIFWRGTRPYLQKNRSAVYLTTSTTIIFYILFAWYVQIVSLGQRFLLPIIPLIFVLLAHGLSCLWQKIATYRPGAKRVLILATTIVMIYQGYWAWRTNIESTGNFLTHNVFEQDRQFNAEAATSLEWLVSGSAEPSVVFWGPSGSSLPAWAYSDRLNFKRYPPGIDTLPELTENLVSREADFIIVDADMVSKYKKLLKETFPSDGARLELTDIPSGWALTYAYRDIPCHWCIFRLLDSSPPRYPVEYQLGSNIWLVGYDLDRLQFEAGQTIHLTIHWQAQAQPEQDYTVFTQLLGPDFQLHGQLDHPPLNNLWPTSRWQPGDHLADRYDILIDPNAPAGEYHLLVGMYDPLTGERLTILHNDNLVPDNAIYLTTVILQPKS